MKRRLSLIYKCVMIGGLCLSASSCKDFFEIEPKDVLESKQVYQNLADADAAVYGVYGKFLELAEQYVILNELRADLLDITPKSSQALKELNTHEVSASNPYANPRKFYEVILYCNDVLKNLDRMHESGKISKVDRDERYSDIGSIRSWLYLQLGIHYGHIPYVTEPIESIDDLKNEALFPKINFDELLQRLLEFTANLPLKEQYQPGVSVFTLPSGAAVTAGGLSVQRMFIYRRLILGDLYLWTNKYVEAATQYREILNDPPTESGVVQGSRHQWTISYSSPYQYGAWRDMFTATFNSNNNSAASAGYNSEWIWSMPFNKDFAPNPFVRLFSYSNGDYQLKPSQLILNKWDNAIRLDGTPGDFRGFGASYSLESGMPVVKKFLAKFDPARPLERTGIWYLNRAADLHLHIAEAANRDNKHRLAYSLLSYELGGLFDPHQGAILYAENNYNANFSSDWPNTSAKRDLTKLQKTPWSYPWNYDASFRNFPSQVRGQFSTHLSIRRRVDLPILRIDSARFFDMSQPKSWRFISNEEQLRERPVIDPEGLMADMEDKILDEGAAELAFEGHRWADLVRIARRRSDPSILAKRVAEKFRAAGDIATADRVEAKLMNMENWYLPFNIK